MKTLLLLIATTAIFAANNDLDSNSSSNNDLSWVDEQVSAIKKDRKSASIAKLNKLNNPFIIIIPKDDKKKKVAAQPIMRNASISNTSTNSIKNVHNVQNNIEPTFKLYAVMNSNALINGKWIKLGESINGYKVMKITQSDVILSKSSKEIKISTKSKYKKLKFSSK